MHGGWSQEVPLSLQTPSGPSGVRHESPIRWQPAGSSVLVARPPEQAVITSAKTRAPNVLIHTPYHGCAVIFTCVRAEAWHERPMITGRYVWVLLSLACSSTPAPIDEDALLWDEACARLSGCEPFASNRGACDAARGTFGYGTTPAECAIAAADCDAAVACFGDGAAPVDCPTLAEPRCDGDVLYECDASLQLEHARDCAAEGLRCLVNGAGVAMCGLDGCTESSCDGASRMNCFFNVLTPWHCSSGRCALEDGFAMCAGEGEPCDDRSLARCEGDVAVRCRGGFIERTACRPGMCRTTDGAFCASDDACAPRCEGTEIVRCVGADTVRYDCAAWGFDGCEASDGVARCR
jgi:hypothetical protein